MAAQAESRKSNSQSRKPANSRGNRNQEPGGNAKMDLSQRGGVGAKTKKGCMTEGNEPGVATEQVPREAEAGPDQNQRQHELVIGVCDDHRNRGISHSENDDRHEGSEKSHDQVRSVTRPKKPWGFRKTISRNTTKMAVFCSWVGRINVESCWTRPMVMPPQN